MEINPYIPEFENEDLVEHAVDDLIGEIILDGQEQRAFHNIVRKIVNNLSDVIVRKCCGDVVTFEKEEILSWLEHYVSVEKDIIMDES